MVSVVETVIVQQTHQHCGSVSGLDVILTLPHLCAPRLVSEWTVSTENSNNDRISLTDYTHLCVDCVIPCKSIKC